jgi:predicted O-methyltransferase YrrM
MNDRTNLHEPERLSAIHTATQATDFSMASEPLTGSLLRTLAASKPGGRFLELGAGTGLSTTWLLDGMDSRSSLTTIDDDPGALSILTENLVSDPRLTVICADGDAFLPSLAGEEFDLIFADTWPGKYRLLDEALALVRPGGFYIVDDMSPQPNWPDGHAEKAARLIETLERRSDFHLTKLSWASGLILATRK